MELKHGFVSLPGALGKAEARLVVTGDLLCDRNYFQDYI